MEDYSLNIEGINSIESRTKHSLEFIVIHLIPDLVTSLEGQRNLREIIEAGIPVVVLRQKGLYFGNHLLLGANIKACEEFEGPLFSDSYFDARKRLFRKITKVRYDA